ncbi:hypothetical protein [Roseobacter sp. HKCCA0434]|uniref:hypothetical protein n=1 Tax=Roseobacter sp. HKCCA0434 TaxID=3079297 RepID=UPI002905D34B|nr:hypothetical protein [Roseobacter sp. HKCCA0434]
MQLSSGHVCDGCGGELEDRRLRTDRLVWWQIVLGGTVLAAVMVLIGVVLG